MRCFQGDRKMKHGKKCKIDKYTLILIVLLLLLTGLVIAWKLPQKEDRYIHVGIAVYDRSDTFMESYIRELEDKYLMKSMMQKGSAAVRKNSCRRCMLRITM